MTRVTDDQLAPGRLSTAVAMDLQQQQQQQQ